MPRFKQLNAEYAKAPEVTRQRLYLETMQQVSNTSKVMVDARARATCCICRSTRSSVRPVLPPRLLLPLVMRRLHRASRPQPTRTKRHRNSRKHPRWNEGAAIRRHRGTAMSACAVTGRGADHA